MFFLKTSFCSSRLAAFCLMLLWMAVIFSFSTLAGKATVGPPPLWYFMERKGAHVVEYAVLMLLSFRFFRLSFIRENFGSVLLLAAVFSIAYGATDELHQFFVPLRGAKITDVLIDSLGVFLAASALFFWKNKSRSL